jgi:hypothetical protein
VRNTLAPLVLFAIATPALGQPRDDRAASTERNSTAIRSPSVVTLADQVARSRLEYLAARSVTMKQMLAVLEMTPGISVRLASKATVARNSQSKAHGLLVVQAAGIRAALEFDSRHATPTQQLDAVAHEIAHVVEVACLTPINGIGQLRRALLGRGFGVRHVPTGIVRIETPFAVQAGREVVVEALASHSGRGKLPELAKKYSLGPPCTDDSGLSAVALPAR